MRKIANKLIELIEDGEINGTDIAVDILTNFLNADDANEYADGMLEYLGYNVDEEGEE